jgi:hypothetical protein
LVLKASPALLAYHASETIGFTSAFALPSYIRRPSKRSSYGCMCLLCNITAIAHSRSQAIDANAQGHAQQALSIWLHLFDMQAYIIIDHII